MDSTEEKLSRLQAEIMELSKEQALIGNNFSHLQTQLIEFIASVKQLKTIVNYCVGLGLISVGIMIGAGILHVHSFSSIITLLAK